MSDDEYVNKENATPIMSLVKQPTGTTPPAAEMRIRVGGVIFVLDHDTLQRLNSEYLNQRLMLKDADDGNITVAAQGGLRKTFSQEDATGVVIEADPECFSAFLHMARFGTLPTSIFNREKRTLLLHQAENIWGIRSQVEEALEKARKDFRLSCDCVGIVNRCLMMSPLTSSIPPDVTGLTRLPAPVPLPVRSEAGSSYASMPPGASAICLSGPHHNFRRDDGQRRVFCSMCGNRDIDWRYHVGDYYSTCQTCSKDILYKPDLGWCHKCRQCSDCQAVECPGIPIKQLNEQVVPFMMACIKTNESSLSFF